LESGRRTVGQEAVGQEAVGQEDVGFSCAFASFPEASKAKRIYREWAEKGEGS